MSTYYLVFDVPDVGSALSFFAYESPSDERKWHYRYGFTLRSTERYGGSGKAGDGDDYILGQDVIDLSKEDIEDGDLEFFLEKFAEKNEPEIPIELVTEYIDDADLCEMSDILRAGGAYSSFEELYFDVVGIEEADDIDKQRAAEVKAYALANGWTFNFA